MFMFFYLFSVPAWFSPECNDTETLYLCRPCHLFPSKGWPMHARTPVQNSDTHFTDIYSYDILHSSYMFCP